MDVAPGRVPGPIPARLGALHFDRGKVRMPKPILFGYQTDLGRLPRVQRLTRDRLEREAGVRVLVAESIR